MLKPSKKISPNKSKETLLDYHAQLVDALNTWDPNRFASPYIRQIYMDLDAVRNELKSKGVAVPHGYVKIQMP